LIEHGTVILFLYYICI